MSKYTAGVFKKVLFDLGISQMKLADILDISQSSVCSYCQGKFNPSLGVLRRLEKYLVKKNMKIDIVKMRK